VEIDGNPCGCGSFGHAEQFVSATSIVRQTKELEIKYPKSILKEKSNLTSANVYKAGKKGDELV
jgi:predicted NBD/HSP70 family sugar kinase